jgi:hypothetical protein
MIRTRAVRLAGTILLSLSLLACEGPAGPQGPMGPAGPAGPQGPQGPGGVTRYSGSGQLDTQGSATRALPAGVGSATNLPAVSCYVSDNANGPWLAITTAEGRICGVGWTGSQVAIVISGAPARWFFQFVAVF